MSHLEFSFLEETLVAWFQRWCGRISSGVLLFKIYGFLNDDLSTADKSQFQENHAVVAPQSRQSLRFGFRGQASSSGRHGRSGLPSCSGFLPQACWPLRGSNSAST